MLNTIHQALSRMSRGSSGDIVATSSSDDDEMKSDGEDADDDCATTTTASSDLTNLTERDGVNILSEATQRRAAISHRARSLQRLGVRAGTAFHRMLADSRLVLLCCWGWDAGLHGDRGTHGLPTSAVYIPLFASAQPHTCSVKRSLTLLAL